MFVVLRNTNSINNNIKVNYMNRIILVMSLIMGLIACGNQATKSSREQEQPTRKEGKANGVEVIYFHGERRCATCLAIEKCTKEVVETTFAKELKDSTLVFRMVDLSKEENKALAEEYGVGWSSLFLVHYQDGEESRENLTLYAFTNAKTKPERFKEGLIEKINARLK